MAVDIFFSRMVRYLTSMKATYKTFSKHPLLLGIAYLLILSALIIIVWMISMIFLQGSGKTLPIFLIHTLIWAVVLLAIAWFLTRSVLPIVRIDDQGIKAYSLFWTRSIAWENIQTRRLIKVENKPHINGARVYFKGCKFPETGNIAILNNGLRVATYIVVSEKAWQMPTSVLIRTIYGHKTIAGRYAIAFQFDQRAWEMIAERAGKKSAVLDLI